MADTTVNAMGGGTAFNINSFDSGLFNLAGVVSTGYFSEQTALAALKAPSATVFILIGGVVVVALLVYMTMKH